MTTRFRLLICLATLLSPWTAATAQEACASKRTPPEAVACMEEKLARIEARQSKLAEPKNLVCTVQRALSGEMRNAEAEVQAPAGFHRVGGGCKIQRAVQGAPAHNGIPIESIPVDNGWRCAVGDPKDFALMTKVEAYVVACKVQ